MRLPKITSLLTAALIGFLFHACSPANLDALLGPQDGDVGKNAFTFSSSPVSFGNSQLAPSYLDSTITVTNSSEVATFVKSFTFNSAEFSLVNNQCPMHPLQIDAGAVCSITIRFSPTGSGDRSGAMTVLYGVDTGSPEKFAMELGLAGRSTSEGVGNPGITFSPSPYDYGQVAASPSFSDRTFTVTNSTTGELFISGFTSNSSVFTLTSSNCPISPQPLAPSATCNAVLRFSPPTDGSFTGALIATYGTSDLVAGTLNARVDVLGSTPTSPLANPAITFAPDYWDFGDNGVSTVSEKSFTVTNSSTSTVYASGFAPSGDSNGDYSVLSTNCPVGLNPFAVNATCSMIIRYVPSASGSSNAKIVASYGPTFATNTTLSNRLVVVGRSSPPPISSSAVTFNPTFWDYGDVANNQSVSKQVTITNASSNTIYIGNIERTTPATFALSNISCPMGGSGLAAGSNCLVNMIYTPTADGSYSTELTVSYGPNLAQATSIQSKMIMIGRSSSTAIGNAALTFNPNFYDFGDKPVMSATNTTITVTNPAGNPPLYIGSVAIPATGNALDFSVFGSTCPTGATTLNANASCQFTVRYSPQAIGFDSTNVTVYYGLDQARNTNYTSSMTVSGRSTNGVIGNEAFTFSPSFYDFGDVAANVTVQTTITVTNTPGEAAAPVFISNITRTTPLLFGVSHDCPISPSSLAVGASCTMTATFRPTSDGVQNSIISILYGPSSLNANINSATMAVTGRSKAATQGNSSLTFTPDYWDYGDVPANTNSDKIIQVQNTSPDAVYISTSNLSEGGPFLITANSCPTGATSLAASATCNITVRFTPTGDTLESLNLRTFYGPDQARSGNLVATMTLAGRSVAVPPGQPIFTHSPGFHDYNDVAQGNTVSQAITLTNASANPVYISNITRSNTAAFAFTEDCPASPTPLAASATCTITLNFTPNAEGAHNTRVDITHGTTAAGSGNLTYSLYAQGRSTAAATGNTQLTFSPTFYDFGDVASGQTATQSVTITNSGATAVNMGTVSVDNALFSTTANTCPTGATQLGSGAFCTITARFSPTADGAQTGFLRYTYGPDQARSGNLLARMPLAGRSTAVPLGNQSITFTPSYWDFGDVASGQSPTRTFTVTNTYPTALHVSNVTSNSPRFTLTDNCPRSPSTLASNGTCSVTVTFAPVADGAFAGDITLFYGPDAPRAANLSAVLTVSGRSTASPTGNPAVTFSPNYHDYGNLLVGANASNAFTVQNSSASSVFIGSVATTSAKYTITANTCPSGATALAASATCTITVQYAPTAETSDIFELDVSYGPDQARNTNLVAAATLIGKSEPPPVGNSAISLSPNTFDFGNVALSPAYSDQAITVQNTSTRNLYFGAVNGLATPFSVVSSNCPTGATAFAGGASCTITVRFSPISGPQVTQTMSVNYGVSQGTNTDYNSQAQFTGRSSPNPPTNFQYTAGNADSVTFTWDANDFDQASFEIQRCDGASCASTFTTAASITGISYTARTYTASGLVEGGIYRYRIRGIAGATQSSWLTGGTVIAFGGITSVDNSSGEAASLAAINCDNSNTAGPYVGLAWTSVGNAAYYQVFDIESGSPQFVKNVDAPASSTVITGLTASQNKTYLVKAFTTSGVSSVNGTGSALTTQSYSPCLTLGQSAPNQVSLAASMRNPRAMTISGNKLIVADQSNNRVLIWNTIPTTSNTPADVVLGQPDMSSYLANNSGVSTAPALLSNKSLNSPQGVAVQGTKLIVSDSSNNRVLVWNTIPTTNFSPADYVLGQPNFVTNTAIGTTNCAIAGRTNGRGLNGPEGVFVDSGGYLYVVDRANNRVLIWTSAITQTQQQANFVLGMSSLTGNCPVATVTQSGLNGPSQVATNGNNIYVADRGNNRILLFNRSALANGMSANGVLGQINYTSNGGACTAAGLNQPYGIWVDSISAATNIYVADYNCHRVKRYLVSNFTGTPVNPAPSASTVIGQTTLTGAAAANTQTGANGPIAGYAVNNANPEAGVWVVHHNSSRINRYDYTASNSNTPSAQLLLGQLSYVVAYDRIGGIASRDLSRPSAVAIGDSGGNTRLAVSEYAANRVHLWDSAPLANHTSASRVLGQSSFSGTLPDRGGTAGSNTIEAPMGVWTNGNRIIVSDTGNNRLLGWRNWPTTDGQSADFVIGQTNMTNTGGSNATNGLNQPITVFASPIPGGGVDDNYIWVADRNNNRVVAYQVTWRTVPLDPPAAALSHFLVLGQPDLTTNTAGITQAKLNGPRGVWSNGDMVVVADTNNNRVLIWNQATTPTTGQLADVVLGQPDFISNTANNGGISASALNTPTSVWVDSGRLFVVDHGNHRVLVWNSIPTENNLASDRVIGQTNFFSLTFNGGVTYPTAYRFYTPHSLWMYLGRMFLSDGATYGAPQNPSNSRVIVIPSY